MYCSFVLTMKLTFSLLLCVFVNAQNDCPPEPESVVLFPYERLPRSANGGCLTGSLKDDNGSDYFHHKEGSPVKDIDAWQDGKNIKAITFKTSDDTFFQIGKLPVGGATKSFTFQPGERLKGSYVLTGNNEGSGLGYMKFETNLGNSFEVGDQKTNFIYESGDSFLMGFYGKSGEIVDLLNFVMMKPLTTVKLTNLTYDIQPLNDQQPKGGTEIRTTNGTPTTVEETRTYTKLTSVTDEFSISKTLTLGAEFSVEASILKVVTIGAKFSVQTSDTVTKTSTKFESTETTQTTTVTAIPCAVTITTFVWFESVKPIDFTGTILHEFKDGTTYAIPTKGQYKTVLTSESQNSVRRESLPSPTATCPGNDTSISTSPTNNPASGPTKSSAPASAPTNSPILKTTGMPAIAKRPTNSPANGPPKPSVSAPTNIPASTATKVPSEGISVNKPANNDFGYLRDFQFEQNRDVYINFIINNGDLSFPTNLEGNTQILKNGNGRRYLMKVV